MRRAPATPTVANATPNAHGMQSANIASTVPNYTVWVRARIAYTPTATRDPRTATRPRA